MSQSKLIYLSFLTFMNNAGMNILCMCTHTHIYICLNLHIFYIFIYGTYIYTYSSVTYSSTEIVFLYGLVFIYNENLGLKMPGQ